MTASAPKTATAIYKCVIKAAHNRSRFCQQLNLVVPQSVFVGQFYMRDPHPHPQCITVNEWQQLSWRTLSATLPACVSAWERERARERERESEGRKEKRDSVGAVAEAVTAVLSSSDASLYRFILLVLSVFLSMPHPLDPPRGNLQCCRDSLAATAWEGENSRNKREREKQRQTDRLHWYRRERQQKKGGEAVAAFFLSYYVFKKTQSDLYGVLRSVTATSFPSKVRTANWRDSWCGLDIPRTAPSSHIQQKVFRFWMRTSNVK